MAREHDPLEEFETQLAELEQRRRWSAQLRAWTPAQRITALYDGRMNLQQFLEWRELAPAEIPPREERRREWSRRLWAMTPAQRVEAMNHDRLTDLYIAGTKGEPRHPHARTAGDPRAARLAARLRDHVERARPSLSSPQAAPDARVGLDAAPAPR